MKCGVELLELLVLKSDGRGRVVDTEEDVVCTQRGQDGLWLRHVRDLPRFAKYARRP